MPAIPGVDGLTGRYPGSKTLVVKTQQQIVEEDDHGKIPLGKPISAIKRAFGIDQDGPTPPPPPPQGFSGSMEGYKEAGERAYAQIVRDIERSGYTVKELPIGQMRQRFNNSYGYEDGSTVYLAKDLDSAKKVEVAYHEWETMRQRKRRRVSHKVAEIDVRKRQRSVAEDYLRNARETMAA